MKTLPSHLKSPHTRIANLWLLTDLSGRRFLIDTGHALERLPLLGQLHAMGIRGPGDLTGILLTHRHSDHAGNAAFLRKRFGARVTCHEFDAGVLRGTSSPPPLNRDREEQKRLGLGKPWFHERLLNAYEDRAPAYCEIDETYQEGNWKWGFRVIPTPGHTEGSVMLYHEPTATLFSGDSILVGQPLWRKTPVLRLADAAFSHDVESCHLAVKRFLKHLPKVDFLCSGHGPFLDEAPELHLRRLSNV